MRSLKARMAQLFLRLKGWTFEGQVPTSPRYVLIAAPHTSNWDLLYFLALAWALEIPVSWMGKDTLFRGPPGWLLRRMGGIPVFRSRRNDLVADMAARFRGAEVLVLTVPAEGTRSRASHWKSGFYRIALAAHVPIVFGYLDYPRKQGGLGPAFHPTGDVKHDMDVVRAFYADKVGLHPESFGPVRLAEEGLDVGA